MDTNNSFQIHDQTAQEYDRLAAEYGYCFPDALFGLCYEYLQSGQRLLDIGIGTGLSSIPFSRAVLYIYGMDGSAELLRICQAKNFATGLKQWDLRSTPWPYADGFFDHAIACGVYHFIPDLKALFQEVARLLMPQGFYAFTTKAPERGGNPGLPFTSETIEGVQIFSHYEEYVNVLTSQTGFEKLKVFRFLQSRGEEGQYDTYNAYVCRRQG
jgi:predicted TPR repeat methyltransferase